MRIIQVFVPLAFTTEEAFQFAIFIIMGNVLRTVAIGNKNVAIAVDSSFGGNKFLGFFVNAGFERHINGH